MERSELKKTVEAVIFYSKKPISLRKISANLPEVDIEDIRGVVAEIEKDFKENHGFNLSKVAGGYLFLTDPSYAGLIQKMEARQKNIKLSNAALETLAIIAFKQPITRAEVEVIRGVGCQPVVNGLIEKKLITTKGRSSELGAPLLYGTTKEFLQFFGLNSLKDLPSPEEL